MLKVIPHSRQFAPHYLQGTTPGRAGPPEKPTNTVFSLWCGQPRLSSLPHSQLQASCLLKGKGSKHQIHTGSHTAQHLAVSSPDDLPLLCSDVQYRGGRPRSRDKTPLSKSLQQRRLRNPGFWTGTHRGETLLLPLLNLLSGNLISISSWAAPAGGHWGASMQCAWGSGLLVPDVLPAPKTLPVP